MRQRYLLKGRATDHEKERKSIKAFKDKLKENQAKERRFGLTRLARRESPYPAIDALALFLTSKFSQHRVICCGANQEAVEIVRARVTIGSG